MSEIESSLPKVDHTYPATTYFRECVNGEGDKVSLYACPDCGDRYPRIRQTTKNNWRVKCTKCRRVGNQSTKFNRSIDNWNRECLGIAAKVGADA